MNDPIVYTPKQSQFLAVPESPLSYWLDERVLTMLGEQTLGDVAAVCQGMATADDGRFVRFTWEAEPGTWRESPTNRRWVPYEEGGGYGKWYGHQYWVVDWELSGARLHNFPRSRVQNEHLFFLPGWTYSYMARGSIGLRRMDGDGIFSDLSSGIFLKGSHRNLASVVNCRFSSMITRSISAKIQLRESYVARIPIPFTIRQAQDEVLHQVSALKARHIEQEITERIFVPHVSTECCLMSDCIMHTVEGYLEQFVMRQYTNSMPLVESVLTETGTPAGWHPLIAGYDTLPQLPQDIDLPPLPDEVFGYLAEHTRITPTLDELVRIKANLQTLYEAGPGSKTGDLDLDDLAHHDDEDEGGGSGAYIPIPTETFLEELSVKLHLHPISVYWLLEELRAEGVRCKPEEQRLLEDRLTVLLLRLLGHRWPKQIEAGEPVPAWADRDGVIPLTRQSGEVTLADRLRARLRAEEGDLGAQQTEALLYELTGRTLEEWLRRDFFKRHISQFKKRPIAWHLASDPTAGGRKKSAEPAFECMVYYHATDSDILARIRNKYLEDLLAPARRDLVQARRDGDDTAAAQATTVIQELEDFAQRLRTVEETGFACKDLEAFLADEPLDRWSGDGVFPPESRAALYAQEAGWHVDINDGVRVNIAPLQAAGLLVRDVLSKKDVPKAIADRARWRSDERRWVRSGKLPRCGWMDESVPESPKWTELAPERERERLRLEEKRQKVLAELNGDIEPS